VLAFAALEIVVPWWLLSDAELRLSSSRSALFIAAIPIMSVVLARFYAAHAIVAPQAVRDPAFDQRCNLPSPTLRVVAEDDSGVVVHGMKLLATGAILANEIWIGNILPLAPENGVESITLAVECNAPDLSLWSRKPLESKATTQFDNPLA
jgi:4-hydroxyphenylacetate 3-monooxygenase